MSLLLACLYLPAASLCLVERTGLLESDNCCSSNADGSSQDDSSDHTACCLLASPTYKLADDPDVQFGVLFLAFLTTDFDKADTLEDLPPEEIFPVSASPPELPIAWQFSFRTALPPRAPSPVA